MSFLKHLKQYAQDLETLAEKEDQTFLEHLSGVFEAGKAFGKRVSGEGKQPDENTRGESNER